MAMRISPTSAPSLLPSRRTRNSPAVIHLHRKPKIGNELSSSAFRPHVLARDRLRLWSAPHSDSFRLSILEQLPLEDILQLFDVMLVSIEPKTRENYGAGLLQFHQYCDSRHIPEARRMPASDFLLASFIASWAGKVAAMTAQNWLASLHFWHNLHGAPWFGHSILRLATAGLAKVVPDSLDLSNAFDASVFAVACTAFWSCCRLGELILVSTSSFDPACHVSRSSSFTRCSPSDGVKYSVLQIPWTKTSHIEGADVIISNLDDITNAFTAINHHLAANITVPMDAPFFAYETAGGGWAAMTKPWFLARCNQIWRSANLLELTSHCFRIGVPPDVVAVQGRWKSRAFLEYWRKIESILPLFVTASFSDSRTAMINSSMDSYARRYS
ncbi:DNA breaking-rejoining enzyme [Suillus subalutaceus]|uniref:DNA breaking-rejoining enzyme n=1 Tax=Suillus subalutaceus TaxID=48586 RepID=UPI001B8660A4|nr:DNA breaking-rejoining enzyme [Suillus subalutaceus]KAG1857315.1 DNA breaking-rejoining enzyme [Suillus subalutaceus]